MKKLPLLRSYKIMSIILLTLGFIQNINASKNTYSKSNAVQSDSIAPDSTGMSSLSAVDFARKFGRGWNLGNTLEAIGGETAWGNPKATQKLIDSVKAAGFNSIRIPVAWSRFTDASTFTIDPAWMARVEEVVNYALKDSMYVIMNEHWDGGWLQPTYALQENGNKRLAAIWQQIAVHFRDYNDHLLFAGTNEVMVDGNYGEPSKEYYTVQNGFNQLFVNTVRSTGGKNVYRYLVVQGFNTNIDYTDSYFTLPQDSVKNRLVVEVHYYDPYNFTINSNSTLYVWGKDALGSESWANESHADAQFNKMKTKFINNNIPVIVGEYAAMARLNLGTDKNAIHAKYRLYYMQYITRSIVGHGLIPFFWDSGFTGNNASGIFDRSKGSQAYPDIIKAIIDTSNVQSPPVKSSIHNNSEALKMYPNPVKASINIEFTNKFVGIAKLYNSRGQVIKVLNVENGINTYDVSDLKSGPYFIQIPTSGGFIAQKFLKN